MNSVNVYRVDLRDFPDLSDRMAAVYVQCFGREPWNEVFQPRDVIARMEAVLDFQDSIFLVAEDDGQVLGATLHYPMRYNAEVLAAVTPDHAGAM